MKVSSSSFSESIISFTVLSISSHNYLHLLFWIYTNSKSSESLYYYYLDYNKSCIIILEKIKLKYAEYNH